MNKKHLMNVMVWDSIVEHPYRTYSVGTIYGLILVIFALFCCGFGDGLYIPLAVTSSPVSMFGVLAALIGGPFVWGCLCLLASKSRIIEFRIIFLASIAVHYAMSFILLGTEKWGDWRYLDRTISDPIGQWLLMTWIFFFIVGEIAIWYGFFFFIESGARSMSRHSERRDKPA
jgi:hypothetical protein